MDNRIHYIYCHTSPSGKKYVGQTSQAPEDRWQGGWGYFKQPAFSKAIRKYGWDAFTHEILAVCCYQSTADYLEQYYIKLYNSLHRDYGYNLTSGGGGAPSHVVSAEMRAHLREMAIERGISPEQRKKMIDALRNSTRKRKPMSDEARRHLSEIHKGSGNWIYGKTHSPETRLKMSASHVGKTLPPEQREKIGESLRNSEKIAARRVPIIQLDQNGNVVKRHRSISEAAKSIGKDTRNILAVCNGAADTAFGFVWRYEDAERQRKCDEVAANRKSKPTKKRAVTQRDLDGNIVAQYDSVLEAARVNGFADASITAVCRGKRDTAHGFIWEYQDESLKAAGEETARKRKSHGSLKKPVIQIDKDGNVVAEYESVRDASRSTGYAESNICASCRNKNRRTSGYRWQYKK